MMAAVGIIALALGWNVWARRMMQQSIAHNERAEAYAQITFHSGSAILDESGQWVEKDKATRVRDAWAWARVIQKSSDRGHRAL
jgi:hypothetical protein